MNRLNIHIRLHLVQKIDSYENTFTKHFIYQYPAYTKSG
jgi:hypothetical protein